MAIEFECDLMRSEHKNLITTLKLYNLNLVSKSLNSKRIRNKFKPSQILSEFDIIKYMHLYNQIKSTYIPTTLLKFMKNKF